MTSNSRPRAMSSSTRGKPLPPLPPRVPRSAPGSPATSDDEDGAAGQAGGSSTPRGTMDDNMTSERPERFSTSGPGMDTQASLDDGGRIDLWMDLKSKLKRQELDLPQDYAVPVKEFAVDKTATDYPILNIVIFLVGSRGDIQPYIALALKMIELHSHRVRIATHGDFKSFVLNANKQLAGKTGKRGIKLEGRLLFFDVGGDPKELMTYMVKNPGLMPGWESLRNGDISKKKKMTGTMLRGFYNSCYFPDPVSGDQFAADAIISNPPTFAHVHVAEALGLPLLMSFTMPWTPTTAYGHPLVNIRASNAEPGLTNYLGYAMADQMMWQGLGHVINSFRKNILGLEKLTSSQGAGVLDMLKVPWTYCWSESLLPMPNDWKEHIDISGFYFLEDAKSYTPPEDLANFLEAGKPSVYIGFGSVPVENPDMVTETIINAMRATGNRAIISAGWAGLGSKGVPDDMVDSIYILTKDCPHDWLFADGRLSAVCHHGGAGTTAIGLRNGLPSIIVPFFGDQKFWGDSIYRAGAGPVPVPPKKLNAKTLAQAIETALDPEVKTKAEKIGQDIRAERGEEKGVDSFHAHLPILNMRCDLDPTRLAIWWDTDMMIKMSGAAAYHLCQVGRLDIKTLQPHRAKEYETVQSNTDPLLGGSQAVLEFVTTSMVSMGQLFVKPQKGVINTLYGIPKGFFGLLGDFYDGFEHGPRAIGSEVREMGKVDGVLSGTYQGLAGAFTGLYDGTVGLVREPILGHRQEGFKGAMKGTGRGLLNFVMHPTRGAIGVFVLPSRGIARSCNRWFNKNDHVLHAPRLAASRLEAASLSVEEQATITRKYDDIVRLGAHARKKTVEKRMRKWFLGDDKAFAVGLDEMGDEADVSLSRANSGTALRSPSDSSDPPPRFSQLNPHPVEDSGSSSPDPRRSSASSSGTPMAYQQRRMERLAHRSSASMSHSSPSPTPLTATTSPQDMPPAFSSTDPHPRHRDDSSVSSPSTSTIPPSENDTIDTQMMMDLKDMYLAQQQPPTQR